MITEKTNGTVLESDKLKVLIEPDNGGKMRSFFSKASRIDIDLIGPECAIPLWTPLKNLKAITSIRKK